MCRRVIFLISVVLVLGLGGNARAELVARYTFDDGTADDSAYYYEDADGTFFDDAHVVDDPCRGQVLSLDGSGDYVKVLNNQVAEFSTESFSYAFWMKTSFVGDFTYFWKGIDYAGEGADNLHGVNIQHDDTAWVRFTLYGYSGPDGGEKVRTEVPEANCVDGTWTHVACVRDAGADELRFYINGKLEPAGEGEGNPVEDTVGDISNTGFLYIGCNDRGYPPDTNSTPSAFFNGMFDDFRAYNHALSDEELERLAGDYVDPNLASDPSPEDGAQNECNDVVLSWTAGDNAVTHDVYFGTGDRDVRDASTLDPEFRVNQPGTTYNAGLLESLQQGETYFWRIDEVNPGHLDSPWKGDVWKFRINDGKAHSPEPADEKRLVPLEQILSWGAGCLAASHDVYFSTDFDDVNEGQPAAFQGNQALEDTDFDPNEWDPCGLDYSRFYYWRIDEVNDATTWEGNVWSFKTKGAIDDPNLRVRYKFDETAGTVAADSSGREYDGDLSGEVSWDADGHDDGCLLFDEGHVIVPTPVLGEIDKEITICAWLNNSVSTGENVVLAAGADWEDFYLRAAVPDEGADVYWRAGNEVNDVMQWKYGNPRAWKGSWNHFAVVKDEDDDKMQIYLNGVQVAQHSGTTSGTLANIRNRRIRIGAETDNDGDYEGKIDDLQVYDRALSANEIAAIFRGGDLASAWAPSPFDGELEVQRDVVLNWRPGDFAVSHDVYLGTDSDDVNDADTTTPVIFRGNQEPNEYNPGGLLMDTVYYWRIDEVNDSNVDSPWKGKVWEFTVANYLIVDDMESYCMGFGCSNEIYDTWLDGYENDTGAEVTLGIDPIEPVHGGGQSMVYLYQSDGGPWGDLAYYSEAERTFDDPCDWTVFGVKALTLFFYGGRNNDANATEQMYVGLEDTREAVSYAQVNYGLYGEDMNDIREAEWHQWDIELSDFGGVQLDAVKKVYIGIGIRGNPNPSGTPGGNGTVYFDNIRLYLPKCVPWRLKPAADFTDDCIVNLADVGEMARKWLKRDLYFDEYTNPGTVGLVGWWKLNENGRSTANDSSIYANHGTISGDYLWVVGYDSNSAVKFSGGKVLVPDAPQLKPAATVSATAWIYYEDNPGGSSRVVVKGRNDAESYCLEADDDDSLTFYVGDVNGVRYFADSEEGDIWPDNWIHLAGTYDGDTSKLYINGEVVATNDEVNSIPLSQDTNDLAIGNKADANDNQFKGTIDDVRVYNRALTAAEVAWLASNGTGFVELNLPENLFGGETPEVINFRDLDVLLDSWLEERLWPE